MSLMPFTAECLKSVWSTHQSVGVYALNCVTHLQDWCLGVPQRR